MNDTEPTQRGRGLFTEGRSRRESGAVFYNLYTQQKTPRVKERSFTSLARLFPEYEDPYTAGHVCFIDKVVLMSVDDDDTPLQQIKERYQRRLEEMEKQMQRQMDSAVKKLEQQRNDIESGPPGLPRRNLASLERLNLGTQTPPPHHLLSPSSLSMKQTCPAV